MFDSLRPCGLYPARLLHLWDFPGKNTGVGCHFLLHGIFPTEGSNLGLPHCRQTLHCLSHQGIKKNSDLSRKRKTPVSADTGRKNVFPNQELNPGCSSEILATRLPGSYTQKEKVDPLCWLLRVSCGILLIQAVAKELELSAELWLSLFYILHVSGDWPFKFLLCLESSRSKAQRGEGRAHCHFIMWCLLPSPDHCSMDAPYWIPDPPFKEPTIRLSGQCKFKQLGNTSACVLMVL